MSRLWKRLKSEILYETGIFRLRRDTSESPRTGKAHPFHVLEATDWVNVIPVTGDGQIVLIEQFRHGLREMHLEIPGGIVPEVVLTAEDSLRSVEELFETASLWEVGSAREKVRRARTALKARGLEAVDYVVAEKLETRSGLEYRAIEELAKAYPDSFAARIMPRLADDDEQVETVAIDRAQVVVEAAVRVVVELTAEGFDRSLHLDPVVRVAPAPAAATPVEQT